MANPHSLEEEVNRIRAMRNVSRVEICDGENEIFDIEKFNRNISSMKKVEPLDTALRKNEHSEISSNDVPEMKTFSITDRHTYVSPEDLSNRWFIIIEQDRRTLSKTTQRFMRSAILPLARRYQADQVFHRKTL